MNAVHADRVRKRSTSTKIFTHPPSLLYVQKKPRNQNETTYPSPYPHHTNQ